MIYEPVVRVHACWDLYRAIEPLVPVDHPLYAELMSIRHQVRHHSAGWGDWFGGDPGTYYANSWDWFPQR